MPTTPSDLRATDLPELKRIKAMAAALCDTCLANGIRHKVSISQAIYGDGTPTILIDLITGYHLVPVHQKISAGELTQVIRAWRAERLVSCAGNEDEDIPAADFLEPLATSSSPESAIAAVILDVHRFWTSEAIDAYMEEEYLHSRPAV